jgi:uncharacterized membrane protein (DUF2068 family)
VRSRHNGLLVAIGVFKLVKAVFLLALAAGLLSRLREDLLRALDLWVRPLHVRRAIERVESASHKQLVDLGLASLAYAAAFATEGVGLVLRKTWAEYLTVIITTSFVPLEVYELIEHRSPVKVAVVIVNVAIVAYLVLRLRSDRQWPFRRTLTASA